MSLSWIGGGCQTLRDLEEVPATNANLTHAVDALSGDYPPHTLTTILNVDAIGF